MMRTPHGGIGELSEGVDEVIVRCARHVPGVHNRSDLVRPAKGHAQAPARQGAFLCAQPVPGLLAGPASGEGAQQFDLQSPHNPTPGSLAFNMLQVVRNRRLNAHTVRSKSRISSSLQWSLTAAMTRVVVPL